jgi:hypothetical protein
MAYASHRYIRDIDDAIHHIRYVGFREREDKSESLGLFSEHENSADAEKFIESLKVKRFKHPDVPVIHTVLFSMSGDEWKRSGFEPGDYQSMIRQVMKEWEIKKGIKLDWVAAEHRNPDHPHCHVVIRAAYKDRDGFEHKLKIDDNDRKFFRACFQETKDIERGFPLPPREYDRYKEYSFDKPINMDIFNKALYMIKRDLEHEEWERERARKKAISKGRSR